MSGSSVRLRKKDTTIISKNISVHTYEIRPRSDDLISETLPFARLWYGDPDAITNAIGYAKFYSRSHNAVIRVYNEAGNVIATHEQAGNFREPWDG